MSSLPIVVLGAGAWGTALAVAAARRHPVLLWARDPAQAQAMAGARCNARYLPESPFPPGLQVTADAAQAADWAARGLAVLGSPMSGLRERLLALPAGARALWLCKGFEAGTGELGHEIARSLRISESTVKVHVAAAFRLLGVHNRVGAVAALQSRGDASAAMRDHLLSRRPTGAGFRTRAFG